MEPDAQLPPRDRDAPGSRKGFRRLLAVLTVLLGLVAIGVGVGFWLVEIGYHLQFIDNEASIVEMEREPRLPNLFGPALLVAGGLWLARQRVTRSTGIGTILAVLLTIFALYHTLTTPIVDTPGHREPFFLRAWDCTSGEKLTTVADDALDSCTPHSIEGSTWLFVESNWPPFEVPPSGIPSAREGQTLTWDELPDGRFYGVLVTDADQAAYDRIVLFPVWKNESPGRNVNMVPADQRNERYPWWVRITFTTDNLLGYDAYFFPAGSGEPASATPPAQATPTT